MIRVLAIIAVVGFLFSVVCFSTAAAVGGRDVAAHGWTIPADWHIDIDDDDDNGRHHGVDGGGETTTREIPWDGSSTLELNVPAELRYTQAPGPAKLVITGPAGTVGQVRLQSGRIDFVDQVRHARRLLIVMTAPGVSTFDLTSRGKLVISGYDQDHLTLDMSGSTDATVSGRTKKVDVQISGSGDADLGQLATDEAKVDIAGSGHAVISPKTNADLDISGSGQVTVLTHPVTVHTNVSGSGRVIQSGGSDAAVTTPPAKS